VRAPKRRHAFVIFSRGLAVDWRSRQWRALWPGPTLSDRHDQHAQTSHLLPVFARVDLGFERGEGAWLIATEGERYLDFTAASR
jgi:4-aminobutyrate aminotransferase-like enzyme